MMCSILYRAKFYTLSMVAFVAASIAGCAAPGEEGYHFGDATRTVYGGVVTLVEMKRDYCTEEDPEVRKSIIDLIRTVDPMYPSEGVCPKASPIPVEVSPTDPLEE